MIQCPGCELELEEDDVLGQRAHMKEFHPDIIKQRQEELERWDGWIDE